MESGEVKNGEVKNGEVKNGEVKNGQVKNGEVESGEVKSGEVKSGEVKSGEVKSGEVKSGEVKSGEVKNGQVVEEVKNGQVVEEVKNGQVVEEVGEEVGEEVVEEVGEVNEKVKNGEVGNDESDVSDDVSKDPSVEDSSDEEMSEDEVSEDESHLVGNVNVNDIIEIISDNEPETLTKIFNVMAENRCLKYYPLITPYHNIEKLIDILLDVNYEYENTWCVHYHAKFICKLFYEGLIPVANKQKIRYMKDLKIRMYREYLLIPKIHFIRSCMHPSEIHISKKVKKKCKQFYITINKDFDGVVNGIIEKHGQNWLYPFIQKEFKKIFEKKVKYKNVQMHSIELWHENELVAGELGNTVGSVYTSLTGFQRKNSAGTIQLCALAKLLEFQNFQLWDLGMLLPYKKEIGSKEIPMKEFFDKHRKFKYIDAEFKVPFMDKLNCAVLIRGIDPSDPTIQLTQPNPT
ncbi:Leu/Phe-tRNA protein transferase, putative [Plasmodium yoelii]|uniref:Leu/Phe-tRNA protein transferase, putative n=1 Tax=Plasmodium yoelii TaxID=5861 RepID=A0A077Y3Y0_PLAYE|nr:Leu/Phe-tRNA protein transferase, putative [Plasmodium yoelii]